MAVSHNTHKILCASLMKSLPNRRLVATARSLFAAKNRLLDACTFCIGAYDLKPKEKKDEEATVKLISKLIDQLLPKEAVARPQPRGGLAQPTEAGQAVADAAAVAPPAAAGGGEVSSGETDMDEEDELLLRCPADKPEPIETADADAAWVIQLVFESGLYSECHFKWQEYIVQLCASTQGAELITPDVMEQARPHTAGEPRFTPFGPSGGSELAVGDALLCDHDL